MTTPQKADLLYGMTAIAEHLGLTEAQGYHLAAKGDLPTFKVGWKVCARRSALDAWLAKKERAAAAAMLAHADALEAEGRKGEGA